MLDKIKKLVNEELNFYQKNYEILNQINKVFKLENVEQKNNKIELEYSYSGNTPLHQVLVGQNFTSFPQFLEERIEENVIDTLPEDNPLYELYPAFRVIKSTGYPVAEPVQYTIAIYLDEEIYSYINITIKRNYITFSADTKNTNDKVISHFLPPVISNTLAYLLERLHFMQIIMDNFPDDVIPFDIASLSYLDKKLLVLDFLGEPTYNELICEYGKVKECEGEIFENFLAEYEIEDPEELHFRLNEIKNVYFYEPSSEETEEDELKQIEQLFEDAFEQVFGPPDNIDPDAEILGIDILEEVDDFADWREIEDDEYIIDEDDEDDEYDI